MENMKYGILEVGQLLLIYIMLNAMNKRIHRILLKSQHEIILVY